MFSPDSIKNTIQKKEDKAIEYIIFQNNELLKQIVDLKEELKNTTIEKNEFEEEIDNVTKSKNMLQSYLKNINEINKLQQSLKIVYEQHFVYNKSIYTSILLLMFVQTLLYTLDFVNVFSNMICMYTTYGIIMYIQYEKRMNVLETCKDIYTNLSAAEKAVDMVVDFIDNL